mgnify:CR=1 FL=1
MPQPTSGLSAEPRHRPRQGPRAGRGRTELARSVAWRLLVAVLAVLSTGGVYDDEPPDYRRTDPDNPGGERVGDDDGDDGFTGYPEDPGRPGDAYRDASSEYRPFSPNWTGAFVGGGLLGGATSLRGEFLEGMDHAPGFGLFLNASTVQQVLDVQVHYLRASYTAPVTPGSADFTRQHAGVALLVHPFFLFVINTPPAAYIIANAYAMIGLGADITDVTGDVDAHYAGLGWRLGGGVDVPIDDPNDGGAFWLGFQWQHAFVRGEPSIDAVGRDRLRENYLLLRLSSRFNGGFSRIGFRPTAP